MSTETEAPQKKSVFTRAMERAESAKPGNMSDEKKETVTRRIKIVGAFAAGVLTTVAAVAAVTKYVTIPTDVEDETPSEEPTPED